MRCFSVRGNAGVQRTSWDLTETAPVPWLRARDWNSGGDGPTVVPGNYTVVLHAAASTVRMPLQVSPDPRASWTQAQYLARYAFVKQLDDELSAIDTALNRLDSVSGVSSFDRLRMTRVLTSGVVNSEDDQLKPDRLRERLTILQGVVSLSQGPPLSPHEREAIAIHAQFESAMTSYRAFLAAHNLPPDLKQEVCE